MKDPLATALDAVRSYVAGREPLSETLQHVAESAITALHVDMAGLTLLFPDGRARTAVSTSDIARTVDQAQYDADRGPCLEAFRQKRQIRVDDTATDDRWPEFATAAQAEGVQSSLSLPLVVAGDGIGALNLYSTRLNQFTEEDAEDAQLFGDQGAVALANAQAYWEQATLAENMTNAMASRATIEQAKGVIMATAGCDPNEAFDRLRQQSQYENRKLRDVAAEIVRNQARRDGDSPPKGAS
jgi:GAF domain-containing protein